MTEVAALAAGRAAFDERRWRDACDQLTVADREVALEPADLDLLGTAAYLAGDPCWQAAWTRAHQVLRDRGELARAVHSAFWLVLGHFNAGEMALGAGWLARGQRLVDELGDDCVEAGYLLLPGAIEACDRDPETSLVTFRRALALGERFGDMDLVVLARHGEARCIIVLGDARRGMALLDEILVAVTAGEVSPIVAGDTYCGAIEACQLTFDVQRAREWTSALNRSYETQPGLEAFRGQCLIYLSVINQTRGDWPGALDVAAQACRRLSEPNIHPAIGAAHYQRGQVQRLRGEFGAAEESYRLAGEHGRDPQPGMAQLRLAQGRADQAAAGMRRLLDEGRDPVVRSAALPAWVEIMLAENDVGAARAGADELRGIGDEFGSAFLRAHASYAVGSVRLAEGRYADALIPLRQALTTFRELDAPYDAARARVLIGKACRELGDADGADVEWQAARRAFALLGAAPDLRRLDALSGIAAASPGPLTARELDILRLVATGRTNRAIGDELVISEKTVARHVSNIFDKLGVSSRAAATSYAYDHDLLQGHT
jgi:DNA-binding CsgD family transcriptional regulator/tetratricopeptide (TPR) repeat protein